MKSFSYYIYYTVSFLSLTVGVFGQRIYSDYFGDSDPHYFLRPAEVATAQQKCESSKGLTGVGVAVYRKDGKITVKYEAICEDGQSIVWNKYNPISNKYDPPTQ